jgi:putative RecB family exonuclease
MCVLFTGQSITKLKKIYRLDINMAQFSHSRLTTFEQCPLKYKFRYIDEEVPEFKTTIEAFMGSRVHDTLELLYNQLKYQKLLTLEELYDFFEKEWKEKFSEDIKFVKENLTEENYFLMGKKFIKDYYERMHPFNQHQLIACEQKINLKLKDNDNYDIIGYIDRLSCTPDGTYYIQDYKTANNLPHQEYLDKDRQLALYSLFVKEKYKDCKKIKLIWHFLAFNKDLESERTDEELEELKKDIIKRIDEINSCTEFEPKMSALCSWCEFRYLCPHFKHLYKLKKINHNEYLGEQGYVLANKYTELKEKEAKIQSEINKVTDAIYQLADDQGFSMLFGEKKKLRIWSKNCVRLPQKNTLLMLELTKLLKSINKFEEIAIVDTWELGKILEANVWPKEITDLLKGFTKKEKIKKIYMSNK